LQALDINNEIRHNKKERAYLRRRVLGRHLVGSGVFQTITTSGIEKDKIKGKIKHTCQSQCEEAGMLEAAYKEVDIYMMGRACDGKARRLAW